jgi:arylsulfatase A-like enzyme
MSIYPTLMDLCGLPTPAHVQGKSIRALLADPQLPWDHPAVTTYRRNNHTIRSESHRYTHYSDGGEEFYDERNDPDEWTNLVRTTGVRLDRSALDKLKTLLPKENVPSADKKK